MAGGSVFLFLSCVTVLRAVFLLLLMVPSERSVSGRDVLVFRKLGVDFTSSLCGSGFRVSGFWFFVVRLALGVCLSLRPLHTERCAETF